MTATNVTPVVRPVVRPAVYGVDERLLRVEIVSEEEQEIILAEVDPETGLMPTVCTWTGRVLRYNQQWGIEDDADEWLETDRLVSGIRPCDGSTPLDVGDRVIIARVDGCPIWLVIQMDCRP